MTSTDKITIRRATVADADGILECLRSAFAPYQHNYSSAGYDDTTLTRESLLQRLDKMSIFVALDDLGRVIGTIACNVIGIAEGHLRGMAVRLEWQSLGIAYRLLERAEAELARQHCSRITLDTTEPLQRAMRFYERHGYCPSGKVGDFFGMPLIEYVKDLSPNY
jgi:predicted N-acetyltransferase YhbS